MLVSSTPIDLSLSGLNATVLLPFHVSWVVTHQPEIFENRSSLNVEILYGLGDSGDNRFGLAGEAATVHPDVHVEEAGVLSDHEGQEDPVTLGSEGEVVQHRHTVDVDGALARLNSDDCSRGLSLSETPGGTVGIKFGFTLLLGEGATEIVQVDAVELGHISQLTGEGTFWEV